MSMTSEIIPELIKHIENTTLLNVIERANRNECDGNCEIRADRHVGICKVYSISKNGFPWGIFSYCEQAVKDDSDNFFDIEELI